MQMLRQRKHSCSVPRKLSCCAKRVHPAEQLERSLSPPMCRSGQGAPVPMKIISESDAADDDDVTMQKSTLRASLTDSTLRTSAMSSAFSRMSPLPPSHPVYCSPLPQIGQAPLLSLRRSLIRRVVTEREPSANRTGDDQEQSLDTAASSPPACHPAPFGAPCQDTVVSQTDGCLPAALATKTTAASRRASIASVVDRRASIASAVDRRASIASAVDGKCPVRDPVRPAMARRTSMTDILVGRSRRLSMPGRMPVEPSRRGSVAASRRGSVGVSRRQSISDMHISLQSTPSRSESCGTTSRVHAPATRHKWIPVFVRLAWCFTVALSPPLLHSFSPT
jgi:hypothetical protein